MLIFKSEECVTLNVRSRQMSKSDGIQSRKQLNKDTMNEKSILKVKCSPL